MWDWGILWDLTHSSSLHNKTLLLKRCLPLQFIYTINLNVNEFVTYLVLQNLNKSFEMKKSLMETEMQKAIADLHSHGLSEEGSYVLNFYYCTKVMIQIH